MTDRAKYWERMLTAWESSGLTQAAFCRQRELKAVTFAWWKRQLRGPSNRGGRGRRGQSRRSTSTGSNEVSLVEVALPEAASQGTCGLSATGIVGAGYEVALPCGTSIRLPVDFDVDRASRLISAVARSC